MQSLEVQHLVDSLISDDTDMGKSNAEAFKELCRLALQSYADFDSAESIHSTQRDSENLKRDRRMLANPSTPDLVRYLLTAMRLYLVEPGSAAGKKPADRQVALARAFKLVTKHGGTKRSEEDDLLVCETYQREFSKELGEFPPSDYERDRARKHATQATLEFMGKEYRDTDANGSDIQRLGELLRRYGVGR